MLQKLKMLLPEKIKNTGNTFPIFLGSTLIGIFFTPILSQKEAVVETIGMSTEIVGIMVIVYTALMILLRKQKWITHKISMSGMTKTRIGFLWMLAIFKCVFIFIHKEIQGRCAEDRKYDNFKNSGKYVSVLFTILQSFMVLYCNRKSFVNSVKLRGVTTLMAVTNLIVWLIGLIFCVFEKADNSNFSVEVYNCSYVKENHLETVIRYTEIFRLPFVMEFSVLATVLIISTPITSDTETFSVSYSSEFNRRHEEREFQLERGTSFTRQQKVSLGIAVFVLNGPFYIFATIFLFDGSIFKSIFHIWVYCLIITKFVSFILILVIFYVLQEEVVIRRRRHQLDLNDVALIASCFAITATGTVSFLIPEEKEFSVIFHSVFNVVHVIYQTVLILFLKSIQIWRRNLKWLTNLKVAIAVLISFNITHWLKDFLFFLGYIEIATSKQFFKSLFYILYPFQSFYRFQCAMELINVYLNL